MRGSEIQEECRKLQRSADLVEAMWAAENNAYESTANKPNPFGVVADETIFPYHNALYSLMDCFDGLEGNRNYADKNIIPPSPAPLPFRSLNGNRRKQSAPTIDAHGGEIMEVEIMEYLPTSAWAIRHAIMPHERQQQFANENESNVHLNHEQQDPTVRRINNDEQRRHRNPRFWNILMDPKPEITPVASSNISLPPLLDDYGLGDDDASMEGFDDNKGDVADTTAPADLRNNGDLARNFTFLSWWEQTIIKERRGIRSSPIAQATAPSFLYLKVLMHSLSELQSDHRLARAVLLLLADCKCCSADNLTNADEEEESGIEYLRRLLSVLSFGYTSCDGYCHESYIEHEEAGDLLDDDVGVNMPNHYCGDWWEFLASLSTLIGYGIENMSEQHASTICAFFMRELDINDANPFDNGSRQSRQLKAYLKQNLHFLNSDGHERDDDDDPSTTITRVHLLSAILSGVRLHAKSDRMRLDSLSQDMDGGTNAHAAIISQSFHTCVNILVDIGERILLRLPSNFCTRQLGGLVVRGLLEAYGGRQIDTKDSFACYLYHSNTDSELRSVIDPLRYANAIANARSHPLINSRSPATNGKEHLIGVQPPRDVQDLVKGLFRRDLVDLNISGCGYGDFLCWCHLPIQPEPLLFDYVSNFPLEDEDEEPPQQYEWIQDEDGFMEYSHLVACYDFSLMMLVREWNKPWTPQSHLSFSLPYRSAISSLALCAHRYGVPASIVEIVNSFLPRSWFHDERMCCWSNDCQLNQLAQLYREKISSRTSDWIGEASRQPELPTTQSRPGKNLTACGCKVAMVCCKDHLKRLRQDGHKRQCGLPPFRPPFSKEDNLFVREIFEGINVELCDEDDVSDVDQNEEDTDSWESVDSNAEEQQRSTMHEKIYSWFNSQSYKIQRREAPDPPFANFF